MTANEAIVLAGGLGTRLHAVVRDVPKPLAPVAGRPFLAFVLDHLAANGMTRCILATGYRGEMVEAAIGNRWAGMEVVYSREMEPLGTGGALALASGHVRGAGAHVLNGDTYLAYDLAGLEAATHALPAMIGMALAQVPDVTRYGAVATDGQRVTGLSEKGGEGRGWINAGCYYFSRASLERLSRPDSFSLERDVIEPLLASGESVAAYAATKGFIDIGVPDDYAIAQERFREETA